MAITGAILTKDLTPAVERIVSSRAVLPTDPRVGDMVWIADEYGIVVCIDDAKTQPTSGKVVWTSMGTQVRTSNVPGDLPSGLPTTFIPTPGTLFINSADEVTWVWGPDPDDTAIPPRNIWVEVPSSPEAQITISDTPGENPAQNPPQVPPVAGDFYINRTSDEVWVYVAQVPPTNTPGWVPLTSTTAHVFTTDAKADNPLTNPQGTIPQSAILDIGDRFINRVDRISWVWGPNPQPTPNPPFGKWNIGAGAVAAAGEAVITATGLSIHITDQDAKDQSAALLALRAGDEIRFKEQGANNWTDITLSQAPARTGDVVTLTGVPRPSGAAIAVGNAGEMKVLRSPNAPGANIWIELPTQNTSVVTDTTGITPATYVWGEPSSIGDIFVNRTDNQSWTLAADPNTATNDQTAAVFAKDGGKPPAIITDIATLNAHTEYGSAAMIAKNYTMTVGQFVMVGATAYRWTGSTWEIVADPNGPQWVLIGSSSSGGASGSGIGQISMFPRDAVPPTHLVCDGSKFDTGKYTGLFAYLGSDSVPDLRNAFIRGTGPGRAAMSKQGQATAMPSNKFTTAAAGKHKHGVDSNKFGTEEDSSGYLTVGGSPRGGMVWGEGLNFILEAGEHAHTVNGGDTETRPQNTALVLAIQALPLATVLGDPITVVKWTAADWKEGSVASYAGGLWIAKQDIVAADTAAPAEPKWEKVAGDGGAWDILVEWDNLADGNAHFTPNWTMHSLYVLESFSRDAVFTKSADGLTFTGVQTSHKLGGAAYSGDHAANTERQLAPNVWMNRCRFEFDAHACGLDMHIHTEDSENIVVKAGGPSTLNGEFAIRWVGGGSGRILALRRKA